MLELAGERHIAITAGGRLRRFTLAPIVRETWLKYFDSIVSTSESRGREQVNTLDTTSPLLAMVADALIDAEGYKLPEGKAKLTEIPEWKSLIPFAHRLAVGNVLTSVTPATEPDGEEGVIGLEEIRLESLWNSDNEGRMTMHRPLLHRFSTPQFKHEQRYMREQSRSKVIGGSRSGKTVWTGVQRMLIDLYDELVLSVEGYTLNGEPLGPAQITTAMDAYHKVVAAQQLFRMPPQPEADEDEATHGV